MNAPWWRPKNDQQPTQGVQSAADEADDDLLPPFFD